MSIRISAALRDAIKDHAGAHGRSVNTHVVMTMSDAIRLAAGEDFGEDAPAAGSEIAALQGGASDHNRNGVSDND